MHEIRCELQIGMKFRESPWELKTIQENRKKNFNLKIIKICFWQWYSFPNCIIHFNSNHGCQKVRDTIFPYRSIYLKSSIYCSFFIFIFFALFSMLQKLNKVILMCTEKLKILFTQAFYVGFFEKISTNKTEFETF